MKFRILSRYAASDVRDGRIADVDEPDISYIGLIRATDVKHLILSDTVGHLGTLLS